jgi:hypothetical protein
MRQRNIGRQRAKKGKPDKKGRVRVIGLRSGLGLGLGLELRLRLRLRLRKVKVYAYG